MYVYSLLFILGTMLNRTVTFANNATVNCNSTKLAINAIQRVFSTRVSPRTGCYAHDRSQPLEIPRKTGREIIHDPLFNKVCIETIAFILTGPGLVHSSFFLHLENRNFFRVLLSLNVNVIVTTFVVCFLVVS